MQTMTAKSAYRQVARDVEKIKNDEPQTIETWSPGDAHAQGDLLFVSLKELPSGAAKIAGFKQLAPGTSQGSRHCLESLEGITLFRLANPTPLDGPVILADRPFTVEHPEHGNITLPAGVVGIVYQRQYADELRRVED